MKKYEAPQAQVVSFDNDYVAATTIPSPGSTSASNVSVTDDNVNTFIDPS